MSTHKVEVVRIEKVEKHPNADRLQICHIYGFNCVTGLNQFKEGDLAIYIEPDYIVPDKPEYAFLKGSLKIKSRRFRGVWSQGLLLPAEPGMKHGDDVMQLLGITRYNPPELSAGKGGTVLSGDAERVPSGLAGLKAYDLENWRKYKNLLTEGEPVVITEKLHGANARVVWHQGRLYVGSRTQWKKANKLVGFSLFLEKLRAFVLSYFPSLKGRWRSRLGKPNAWWTAVENSPWVESWCKSNPDKVLYGEIYGQVQDLKYGAAPGEVFFRAFDVLDLRTRNYMDAKDFIEEFDELQRVPLLYSGPYNAKEVEVLSILERSTLADHIGEGIVIKPSVERRDPRHGRVALKLVSDLYLERH